MKNVTLFLLIITCLLCFACDHNSQSLLVPNDQAKQYLVYYSAVDGDIHIADNTGESNLPFELIPSYSYYYPKWSPEGNLILLARIEENIHDLYTINTNGAGLLNITNTPYTDEHYHCWSPDGGYILFSEGNGQEWELYTIRKDGTDKKQLTEMNTRCAFPSWSPDGNYIIFNANNEIYIVDRSGTNLHKIYSAEGNRLWLRYPKWSPDGRYITVHAKPSSEILVMNSDGSNVRTFVAGNMIQFDYDWSPDGTQIAYSEDGTLLLVDLSGSVTRLTSDSLYNDGPVFSPDGSMIAFCSSNLPWWSSLSGPRNSQLKIINVSQTSHESLLLGRTIQTSLPDWNPIIH
ncbi:TolB family protein [candidate division KSB1 bacterium]